MSQDKQILKERFEMISELVRKNFEENQSCDSELFIFFKDKKVDVIDVSEFMVNYDSKNILAFSVQYMMLMLENVDFIVLTNEAYGLAIECKSPEEAQAKQQEIMEKYGSISNSPYAKEIVVISYDDSEFVCCETMNIEKNDQGRKCLDPFDNLDFLDQSLEVDFGGSTLGGLLTKSKYLGQSIERLKEITKENVTEEEFNSTDFHHLSAVFITQQMGTKWAMQGLSIALQAVDQIKAKRQSKIDVVSHEPPRYMM